MYMGFFLFTLCSPEKQQRHTHTYILIHDWFQFHARISSARSFIASHSAGLVSVTIRNNGKHSKYRWWSQTNTYAQRRARARARGGQLYIYIQNLCSNFQYVAHLCVFSVFFLSFPILFPRCFVFPQAYSRIVCYACISRLIPSVAFHINALRLWLFKFRYSFGLHGSQFVTHMQTNTHTL